MSRGATKRKYFYTVPLEEARASIVLLGFTPVMMVEPLRLDVVSPATGYIITLTVFEHKVSRNSLQKLIQLAGKEGIL